MNLDKNHMPHGEDTGKSLGKSILSFIRAKIHQLFIWEEVEVTFTNNPISSYSYKKVDEPLNS